MLNVDLIPGQEYAFREKRVIGSPLHRVKLLKHIRGRKWQAKWIKPNPNLIDYLSTEQVIVPWKDQAAFMKEERDRESLRDLDAYVEKHKQHGTDDPVFRPLPVHEPSTSSKLKGDDYAASSGNRKPVSAERQRGLVDQIPSQRKIVS